MITSSHNINDITHHEKSVLSSEAGVLNHIAAAVLKVSLALVMSGRGEASYLSQIKDRIS
jgi:hypothetical protein